MFDHSTVHRLFENGRSIRFVNHLCVQLTWPCLLLSLLAYSSCSEWSQNMVSCLIYIKLIITNEDGNWQHSPLYLVDMVLNDVDQVASLR